jgi:hypothetical protein
MDWQALTLSLRLAGWTVAILLPLGIFVARILAWFLFAVWATWSFALGGWLATGSAARWVPDAGLVLALSVLARAEAADALLIALIAAIARAAFGPEPPVVLLTGFLIVVFLALAARRAVEISGAVWRGSLALLSVLVFDAWLRIAQSMRGTGAEPLHVSALFSAWPAAVTSAFLALACGPLLAQLPGLTPIRRRSW